MSKFNDEFELDGIEKGHGKKPNQKLKPYLVMQYLLKYSDESHLVSAPELVGYLQEICGIYAERRSIYRDIEEINKAILMVENEVDIYEVEEMLESENDPEGDNRTIVYDRSRKGFYVRQRHYEYDDIRLLAEDNKSLKSYTKFKF